MDYGLEIWEVETFFCHELMAAFVSYDKVKETVCDILEEEEREEDATSPSPPKATRKRS